MSEFVRTFLDGIGEINSGSNIVNTVAAVLVALVMGLIIFATYKITCRAFAFDQEMGLVLIVVPIVVALLLSVIGTNIARAFSLAGALSIVRYRSALISPRNVVFIFFGMGAGFITGTGLYLPALIFVLVTCVVIVLYTFVAAGGRKTSEPKTLSVAVPESINYDGLLDATLEKYTTAYALSGVRLTGGGTLVELTYHIRMKDGSQTKAFLDEIRMLNGNFKIQLMQYRQEASAS